MRMRRLHVSLTDAQWQFLAMHRRGGSIPACVRHLIDETMKRESEEFAAIEEFLGIAEQREQEARTKAAKQEARRVTKRLYMRQRRANKP
jgi:hypothetical protein